MAYFKKSGTQAKRDLYQEVTDKVVAQLEAALAAGSRWTKPWVATAAGQPISVDGRPYRGMNWWLLALTGSESGVWGTYRAWERHGAQVKKGEKGTLVVLWKKADPKKGEKADDEDGKPAKKKGGLFLKHFIVFSAEQVENFDLDAFQAKRDRAMPGAPGEVVPLADDVIADFYVREGLKSGTSGDRAFYAPSHDMVAMPPVAAFETRAAYYGTHLHELVHSTGAKHRLDRKFGERFGDDAYAFEELVAELGAAMLCASLGVSAEPRQDHAEYLASWIKVLKGDKRAVFTASSKAQAAADRIHRVEATEDEGEGEAVAAPAVPAEPTLALAA